MLEPTLSEMENMLAQASTLTHAYLAAIARAPAHDLASLPTRLERLREPMPTTPTPLLACLDTVREVVVGCAVNAAGGTYQAYIPGGGIYAAAVAEYVAASLNRYVTVWGVGPGPSRLEAVVLEWFRDLLGLPDSTRGVLTSGGSLANFSAVVTARRARLPENFLNGVIYASRHTHHSVTKAAMLAGFSPRQVHVLPTDPRHRLDVDALESAVAADRAAGLVPFMLVANAGTTNTGAVDPLRELAARAAHHKLWLHVDAAYGGFFMLTARGRELLDGIELADSVTLDPHKGLFLPYGVGSLLVRDGEALRRAHHVEASYLRDLESDDADQINFAEYGPELTRSFRGLNVWLPLKLYGSDTFARYLDEKLDLARHAYERLRGMPGIEVLMAPQLTVVAFRASSDEASQRVLETVNASRRSFISSTVIDGRTTLRIAVLSFRTHREQVDATLDLIAGAL